MKPIFSVHAGEYLTGSYIEQKFPNVNLWIPAKDTGIDLLVSDRPNRKTVSLQVKFSKDFLVTSKNWKAPEFQHKLRACGWWTLNSEKLLCSHADYWVFVLRQQECGLCRDSTARTVAPFAPHSSWATPNLAGLPVGHKGRPMLGHS